MSAQVFRAQIGKWKGKTQAKLDALARQTCFEMGQRVVQRTPVDTGFLRGSWQPSVGSPELAKGKLDPAGLSALSDLGVKVAGIKPGDAFFMLNNAAYARFIEYGTSKMAGRFFVTQTVKNWQNVVDEVAADLGMTA